MSANNPSELKSQLHAIMTVVWIGIPGFTLLEEKAKTEPEWDFPMITRYHSEPFGIWPTLEALRSDRDSETYQFYRWNFLVQLANATLPHAFQIVEDFCSKHNIPDFHNQSWYWFLKAIRNAMTHNGRLESPDRNKDRIKKILASQWREKKIEPEMLGRPIPLALFDFDDLIRLIDDIGTFIDHLAEKWEK